MKKLLFAGVAVIIATSFVTVLHAEDTDHDEARIQHYVAEDIADVDAAKSALHEHSEKIEAILKSRDLKGSELEKVHEITYTLEAAVDKLKAEKAADAAQLDVLDEAVQALHHASENHEEAKVREWFGKLELASAALGVESEEETAAVEDGVYNIVIKDHQFTPNEIHVPAGKKIKLVVENQDPTPEEFESDDFRREKIIAGNSQATIFVGPLKAGKYHFFGEFNLDTANGYIIAE